MRDYYIGPMMPMGYAAMPTLLFKLLYEAAVDYFLDVVHLAVCIYGYRCMAVLQAVWMCCRHSCMCQYKFRTHNATRTLPHCRQVRPNSTHVCLLPAMVHGDQQCIHDEKAQGNYCAITAAQPVLMDYQMYYLEVEVLV
jgi:hypothetical protein